MSIVKTIDHQMELSNGSQTNRSHSLQSDWGSMAAVAMPMLHSEVLGEERVVSVQERRAVVPGWESNTDWRSFGS
jgi:hypothetical protein